MNAVNDNLGIGQKRLDNITKSPVHVHHDGFNIVSIGNPLR